MLAWVILQGEELVKVCLDHLKIHHNLSLQTITFYRKLLYALDQEIKVQSWLLIVFQLVSGRVYL